MGALTYNMVHANIHPGDKVLLSDVLPIKEIMKVDGWFLHIVCD